MCVCVLSMMMMQQQQQLPSPALSSPSAGFFAPRASPSVDQPEPLHLLLTSSELPALTRLSPAALDSSSPLPDHEQAPPKQLAQAMEGLGQAIRLIAEVRLGSDLLLEALERATAQRGSGANSRKASEWVVAAAESMRQSLDALRSTGRKLEASGVLNGAQQRFEEKQPWGLQVPLVCPDGAIVSYSWKRQIAGQAAASAVDRTRLALKAFTEQKRHFFPRVGDCMDDTTDSIPSSTSTKRSRTTPCNGAYGLEQNVHNVSLDYTLLSDVLQHWQQEDLNIVISSFTRLDWCKRTAALANSKGNVAAGSADISQFTKPVKQEPVLASTAASASAQVSTPLDSGISLVDKVAILEVRLPTVFKAIISLFPAGSACPDGFSVFAIEEVGSYIHPVGVSVHNVFRQISEYGKTVLHNFFRFSRSTALALLLEWLYTYRSLFTKPCSQCNRILALDRSSDLFLPPLVRPFNQVIRTSMAKLHAKLDELNEDKILAYHLACVQREE